MELLSQLAQQGILGLLLALTIVGNVYQYRQNNVLQEKRVQENIAYRDSIGGTLKDISETITQMVKLLRDESTGISLKAIAQQLEEVISRQRRKDIDA